MRYLVLEYISSYAAAKYRDKQQMTSRLIADIKLKGGQFLKLHADGWWIEAEDSLAEDKVSQAFRTVRMEKVSKTKEFRTQESKNDIVKANGEDYLIELFISPICVRSLFKC
jgi:hypothetical protein